MNSSLMMPRTGRQDRLWHLALLLVVAWQASAVTGYSVRGDPQAIEGARRRLVAEAMSPKRARLKSDPPPLFGPDFLVIGGCHASRTVQPCHHGHAGSLSDQQAAYAHACTARHGRPMSNELLAWLLRCALQGSRSAAPVPYGTTSPCTRWCAAHGVPARYAGACALRCPAPCMLTRCSLSVGWDGISMPAMTCAAMCCALLCGYWQHAFIPRDHGWLRTPPTRPAAAAPALQVSCPAQKELMYWTRRKDEGGCAGNLAFYLR